MRIIISLVLTGFILAGVFSSNVSAGRFFASNQRFLQQSRPYMGKFVWNSGQISLSLDLIQHADGQVMGTLNRSNGTVFQVKGMYQEGGMVTGICSDDGGILFFAAYMEGQKMHFALYEPDANNQPNYDTEQELVFLKVAQSASHNAGRVNSQFQEPAQSHQAISAPQTSQQYTDGQVASESSEVGDISWGFKFVLPQGWGGQKNAREIILGHHTIPGTIIVSPHTAASVQQMRGLMMQGIQEEGASLSPAGSIQPLSDNILTGDYTGLINWQQMRAKGYGVLSPYGGGAFILAISTPDTMSKELASAAHWIATNMNYVKSGAGGSSDLTQFFSDIWVNTTTNTSSYVYLYSNGTWSDHSESHYSGSFTGDGGANTGNWGAGGTQSGKGRWIVRGNRDQGQLIISSPSGDQTVYEYHVQVENGQKYYSEYYFNGTLYHRKNEYD